jgi:3-oxoacyl-[acyl-carrier-protein] synthase II
MPRALGGIVNEPILITGAGVVSSIGMGVEAFERALYAGQFGIGPSQMFGDAAATAPITAEVRDFSPQPWLGNKGIRVLDRIARLLCVSAHMALCGSGLARAAASDADPEIGLVCGTMLGSVHSITSFDWSGLTDGPSYVNPMDFPNTVINSAAGQAAIKFKLGGVNSTICGGGAAGLYALHYASEFLRLGRARVLLAGGAEELSEESLLGFRQNGLASRSGCLYPFGVQADGTVLGEAAVLLVLESAESARARGAQPWAEMSGFGSAHDAHSTHAFDVRAEGATDAIRMALESAGIGPKQIVCIVSAASGSRSGDEMEKRALANVFGARLTEVPVCAPKAAVGETLGAAGALGALVGTLALRHQCLPPTPGIDYGIEGLRLLNREQPIDIRERGGDYALINAFSCDGNNAAMVLRRVGTSA